MQTWILLAVKQNTNWGHWVFLLLFHLFVCVWWCLKFCWLNGLKDKEICNILNSLSIGQVVPGCLGREGGFCDKTSPQHYCYFFCPSRGGVLKNICFRNWRAAWGWRAFDLLTLFGVYQKRVQRPGVSQSSSWRSTHGSPFCGCFPSSPTSSGTLILKVILKK